jgi:ABC-type uncharacterized transport system permease subunit
MELIEKKICTAILCLFAWLVFSLLLVMRSELCWLCSLWFGMIAMFVARVSRFKNLLDSCDVDVL